MKRFLLAGLVTALGLSLAAGCPTQDSRTSNQGGGSVISAATKFATGNLSGLTPDEIQVVGDFVAGVSPKFAELAVTDEEAQAAVDFLVANGIDSVADAQALAQNPGSVEIPESVQAIVEATSLEQFKH